MIPLAEQPGKPPADMEDKSMGRYDIAIIGSGPAGLSAAITAKIRNKNIIVFGSADLSTKLSKAHEIQNYLGFPAVKGADLAAAFQKHIESMGISITEKKITSVYAMGDYYALQTSANEMIEADSVILASGVTNGKPYPGEEKFLGRGVSYCATCDAPLYRGKTVAVISSSPKEEAEADFLAEVAGTVYYCPLYKEEPVFRNNVIVIREKPLEIIGEMKTSALKTDGGEYPVDCVFILRESQFPGQLVPGLQVENNHIKVDLQMKTNLPGCYACGDIAGLPYQYIKAAGQGNTAALSAAAYLDEKKRNQK